MSAPVVGIVGHRYVVPRPHVELDVTGTPRAYADRVAAAGGRPLVLPAGRAVDLLDLVDALVLTGGGDVDPACYGRDTAAALDVERSRDDDEVALVHAAAAAGVPLLGVCRGLQVLVVAFGGTLLADLDGHRLPAAGHPVSLARGTLVDDLLGPRPHVSSLHHQSVDEPGPCWRVTARADDDVVEAVEWAGHHEWPVVGVQWHPELPDDPTGERLFGWLVAAGRQVCTRETRPFLGRHRVHAPSRHVVASAGDPA